jgi:hypothetical protein
VYVFYTQNKNQTQLNCFFVSVWPSIEFPLLLLLWSVVALYRKKKILGLCHVVIVLKTKIARTIEKVSTLTYCEHKGHPIPRDASCFLTSLHVKNVFNVFSSQACTVRSLGADGGGGASVSHSCMF